LPENNDRLEEPEKCRKNHKKCKHIRLGSFYFRGMIEKRCRTIKKKLPQNMDKKSASAFFQSRTGGGSKALENKKAFLSLFMHRKNWV